MNRPTPPTLLVLFSVAAAWAFQAGCRPAAPDAARTEMPPGSSREGGATATPTTSYPGGTSSSSSVGATCTAAELLGGGARGDEASPLTERATEIQEIAPPAISGGTLLVLPGTDTAIAADPDRDQIYLVDLGVRRLTATVALNRGDEPGRVIADRRGQVHLALRGGGALVTIDPAAGVVTARRSVCAAPRGLAHDANTDLIHVACAGGELVSLPASGGEARRTLRLDRDLRDVVVDGNQLQISRFRSAELITVAADGTIIKRRNSGGVRSAMNRGGQLFTPSVAWRLVSLSGKGMAMVHQRGVMDEVQQGAIGSYGGVDPCHAIVHSAVTRLGADGSMVNGPALAAFPLPVDLAASADGAMMAVISAGNGYATGAEGATPAPSLKVAAVEYFVDGTVGCRRHATEVSCSHPQSRDGIGGCSEKVPNVVGEAIAVAFTSDGNVVVQSREPAVLNIPGADPIVLSRLSRNDSGHGLFHANAGTGLACASCHVEGKDDGRVWNFACAGGRRTQSLQIGIRGTEPLHWEGDQNDFPRLVRDVFSKRMSGPILRADQVDAMLAWLDHQPRPAQASASDSGAVQRGRAIYNDAGKGDCLRCHNGARLTNNQTVDVGTGAAFQVPSLVGIADRAPFMHDGCAPTLLERFSPGCGGGDKHGKTSHLAPTEVVDLIHYLETL